MQPRQRLAPLVLMNSSWLILWSLFLAQLAFGDQLEREFIHPPASARPWVYWFVMDGNLSREGITADLEAMQRVGIGGVIFMEVDVGVPRGPVRFMSEQWRTLFKHAVEEAERLGLEITLNAGPGWTGSGGPWVKPEQSMQHLVANATNVFGPGLAKLKLPQPVPRKPYFGIEGLSPEMIKAQQSFYREVAVLAFPARNNAAQITDIDEKALYVRHPYSSRPGTKPYFPSPTAAGTDSTGAVLLKEMLNLTANLQSNGALTWNVPPGEWTILRFGRTSTGANTRPAPQPGLGLECDKFDRAALDAHFDAFVGSLLRAVGPRPKRRASGWTALHIDSWEMGAQNWTASFRHEFQRRRGYDPLPYLPAYTGRLVESPEITERFLWDVRLTAQELVLWNHARHLKDVGHAHGFKLSIEPYDMNPCADLALGGVADVPMCEFWAAGDGFLTTFSCFEAISVAHTRARPIVGAEAFTGAGNQSWTRHPGSMKNQADWALAAGINRLVFHRFAHQPWTNRVPGMTMSSIGTQYERTQTWWEMSGPWHEYLARCQHLLRQGLPVADILYLAPEGAPQVFRPPPSALAGSVEMPDRKGYNFDGCDPQTLLEKVKVRNGRLVLPDGMSYRVLVLPEVDTMTPALLRKIAALLEAGATIIGRAPAKSPSLEKYPRCDDEVRKRTAKIWGSGSATQIGWRHLLVPARSEANSRDATADVNSAPGMAGLPQLYGNYSEVAQVLAAQMSVPPDFESEPPLRYTHRQLKDVELYFVSNPVHSPVTARCSFRVAAKRAERWDPVTGRIESLNCEQREGLTRTTISLAPHGSFFVVFHHGPGNVSTTAQPPAPATEQIAIMEIKGPWDLHFQRDRGAPGKVTLKHLSSWSEHPEPGVKFFSGIATYSTTFSVHELKPSSGTASVFLDLGEVEVMAEVTLNGHKFPTLWCRPFRVDVTSALKPGDNEIEIKVANLWPNRMIGDAAIEDPSRRITFSTFTPFAKESPLLKSGLLGPVRLLTH